MKKLKFLLSQEPNSSLLVLRRSKKRSACMLFFFSTLLSLLAFPAWGQNVDRKFILIEKWTGTWCTYCPSAAMGVHDLVDSGCNVVIVSYHSGDNFQIDEGMERKQISDKIFSDLGGLPTVQFDAKVRTGKTLKDSANSSKMLSAYPIYKPIYDSLILCKTPITISLSKRKGKTYKECIITATIQVKNPNYEGKDRMQLLAALTESHIPTAWRNQPSVEYAARSMYKGNKGSIIQLDAEGQAIVEFTIPIEPMYETLNCEIVCWVQDTASLQVLESDHIAVLDNENINLDAPRNFKADNIKGTLSAHIRWNQPLLNKEYTVIGYNIIQKGKLINKTGLIEDTFYITPKLNLGENCFSIQTIYDCKSILSDTVCINISTLPSPANLDTATIRTQNYTLVNLSWNAPVDYEEDKEDASALKAYYVYRDGKKVGETQRLQAFFKDSLLYKGNYTYSVSALYHNEGIETESNKSESIRVELSGEITIEKDVKIQYNLYPNPCRENYVNVECTTKRYEIFNLKGVMMQQGTINHHRIDLSNLENGVYIVRIDGRSYSKLNILR